MHNTAIRHAWSIASLVWLLWPTPPAGAVATYRYEGAAFDTFQEVYVLPGIDPGPLIDDYDGSMRVTGHFRLDQPLAPSLALTDISSLVREISFSDGRQEIGADRNSLRALVATDASGAIVEWDFRLSIARGPTAGCSPDLDCDLFGSIATQSLPEEILDVGRTTVRGSGTFWIEFAEEYGRVEGVAGGFTLVPEPSTAALMTLGLVGLAWRGRRKTAGGSLLPSPGSARARGTRGS